MPQNYHSPNSPKTFTKSGTMERFFAAFRMTGKKRGKNTGWRKESGRKGNNPSWKR